MKFQITVGKVSIKATDVLGADHIQGTPEKPFETKFHTAPVDVELENIGLAYELDAQEIDVLQANARENIATIASTIDQYIEPIAAKISELQRKSDAARREDMAREEEEREARRKQRELEFEERMAAIRAKKEQLNAGRKSRVAFPEKEEEVISKEEINKAVL